MRRPANSDPLEYEILQEKAANLVRLGTRLENALRALAEYDDAGGREGVSAGDDPGRREALVTAAGEALWYYIVQREVCGLHDGEEIMRELRVPREVRLRMGYFPPRVRR